MTRLSEHFTSEEFTCQCGCGFGSRPGDVSPSLISKLEEMRLSTGPITINSGCRCASHNTAIGGSVLSAHLSGEAADIACPSSRRAYIVVKAAMAIGISRIGVERGCIHVDVSRSLPQGVLFGWDRQQHLG